jgi:hypothetical protein
MVKRKSSRQHAFAVKRPPGAPLVSSPTFFPPWLKILVFVAILNFFAFCGVAGYLGGDALNGYASEGHYFLKWRSNYTEVSPDVFAYSKWHAISVIVLFGATAIAGALARRRAKKARFR